MDSENKFWSIIWSLITGTVCVFIITVAGCDVVNTKNKLDLLEKVQDPIAVACAWTLDHKAICMAKVLNK